MGYAYRGVKHNTVPRRISSKPKRVRIHAGEGTTYRGYNRVLDMGIREVLEGYREGCSCHKSTLYVVPDIEGYNMIRYPKGWIWGSEFQKTIYYI